MNDYVNANQSLIENNKWVLYITYFTINLSKIENSTSSGGVQGGAGTDGKEVKVFPQTNEGCHFATRFNNISIKF